jgi:hypothetical protein
MNMLWSTGLLTALLAAVFSLRWRSLFPEGAAALALALAGNSLRAAILFFPEAGIVNMPHILHSGIGIAIAGGCFLVLMELARRLSAKGALPLGGVSSGQPTANSPLTISAIFVLLASFVSAKESLQPMPETPVLASYQGIPVTRIPLNPAKATFYRKFPSSIAVYEADGVKLISGNINAATRKLHPDSHCLRAEGFSTREAKVWDDGWLSYTAARTGEIFQVKERITCLANGRSWPEISAWFWHALFHPSEAPWEAVTAISATRP